MVFNGRFVSYCGLLGFIWLEITNAIELNLSSIDSIKSVTRSLTYDLMSIYKGNETGQTPGMLPFPGYFWWESGGMWGTLIDYWSYTSDSTYNDQIQEGLLFQAGSKWDYLPRNSTIGMGNDDQGFWAMAVMSAAEANFPNPPEDGPQWLGLAQSVFDQYTDRYMKEQAQPENWCGGGLRWQVYFFLEGWMYKNSISNGCLFNLGARLAKFTGNNTYAEWAEKTWDWMIDMKLMELQDYNETAAKNFTIDSKGAGGYVIWDGATVESNCSGINGVPYSYNAAVFVHGAAMMYNYTNGSDIWANRTQLLVNATLNAFFRNGIAVELTCEPNMSCNVDMLFFKAVLARSLAATIQLAPFTKKLIMPLLASSAKAAALQCSGGANGRMCGLTWVNGSKWDGTQGAGQQMAAMEVILSNLLEFDEVPPPLSISTGASSVSGNRTPPSTLPVWVPSNRGDKAGAAFLTFCLVVGIGLVFAWLCSDLNESGLGSEPPLAEADLGGEHSMIDGKSSRESSTIDGKGKAKEGTHLEIKTEEIPC